MNKLLQLTVLFISNNARNQTPNPLNRYLYQYLNKCFEFYICYRRSELFQTIDFSIKRNVCTSEIGPGLPRVPNFDTPTQLLLHYNGDNLVYPFTAYIRVLYMLLAKFSHLQVIGKKKHSSK